MPGTATDARPPGPGKARAYAPGLLAGAAWFALALFDGAQTPLATAAMAVAVWWALALSLLIVPRPVRLGRPGLVAVGALVAIAALAAASAGWADDDGRVLIEVVRALAYLGALLIVVVGVRAGEIRAVLAGVAAAIVAISLLALGSRFAPGVLTGDATFLREFPEAVRGRLSYPLGYWNGLAACMAGGFVLLAWLGSHAPARGARALAVGAMPALLLTIYLTGSRGGLLAAIAGLVVLLALEPVRVRALAGVAIGAAGGLGLSLAASTDQDLVEGVAGRPNAYAIAALTAAAMLAAFVLRRAVDRPLSRPRTPALLRGRVLAGAAVAALVALFVLGDGIERVGEIREPAVDDYGRGEFSGRFLAVGSNGRIQLWESALDAWESEPLHGIGAGSYEFWWNQHGTLAEPARDAHSLFLESLAELGPLGLLAVLALFGSGAWAAARLTFGDRDGTVAVLAGLLAAGAAGAAVDWTWEIPAAFSLNLLAIGLLTGPLSMPARATARAPGRGRGLRFAGAGLALAFVFLAGTLLLSERSLDRSRELAAEGDFSGAAEAARAAARLQPGSEEPWLQLGQVQVLAGDTEAGAESFREAVERSPESPQANLALAVALYSIGDPDAAEQEDRAVALLPADR